MLGSRLRRDFFISSHFFWQTLYIALKVTLHCISSFIEPTYSHSQLELLVRTPCRHFLMHWVPLLCHFFRVDNVLIEHHLNVALQFELQKCSKQKSHYKQIKFILIVYLVLEEVFTIMTFDCRLKIWLQFEISEDLRKIKGKMKTQNLEFFQ